MNGPLSGYRVLDLTIAIAGPSATVILADQGAEVVKVEPPAGDMTRMPVGPSRNGMSATFIGFNRNKKSLALDLKTKEAREALLKLAATCDVFVQNLRPGAADRLGLSERELRGVRPDLIYVSLSGYGETGPYVHRAGLDPTLQGLSGMAYSQADDDGRPRMIRSPIIDKLTGLVAAQAITAALCERERTKSGRSLQLSMLDLAIAFNWPDVMGVEMFVDGESAARLGDGEWLHPTSDGWIIAMPVSDKHVQTLAELSGKLEWLSDPQLNTATARFRYRSEFSVALRTAFLGRSTEEWVQLLEQADIPYSKVLPPEAVDRDPQVRHNRIVVERDHPVAGRLRETRSPTVFDHEPLPLHGHAPTIGEHNAEILGRLGYSPAEIEALMPQTDNAKRGGRFLSG